MLKLKPEKVYRTRMTHTPNSTNYSFTVPRRLVVRYHIKKGSPWQWMPNKTLVPFEGTIEQAVRRKKEVGDVVWLQRMRRENGSTQDKLNIPRDILERYVNEEEYVRVTVEWIPGKMLTGKVMLETATTAAVS